MISWESASSVFQPKFMVPRQRRETDRPLRPRCVYSMRFHPGTLSVVPQRRCNLARSHAPRPSAAPRTAGLVADLDPGWDVGGGILNGGYLLAVAARAAVLDSPHPHPVAVSASYLRATGPGPVSSRSRPGPAGRTLAHSRRRCSPAPDGPTLSVQVTTATLGDDAAGVRPARARRSPRSRSASPTRTARPRRPPGAGGGAAAPRRDAGWTRRPRAGRWAGPSGEPVMRGWVRLADGSCARPVRAAAVRRRAAARPAGRSGMIGWAPTVQLQVLVRALPGPRAGAWSRRAPARSPAAGSTRTTGSGTPTGRLVAQSRQLARTPR